jgi:hypothetical protein
MNLIDEILSCIRRLISANRHHESRITDLEKEKQRIQWDSQDQIGELIHQRTELEKQLRGSINKKEHCDMVNDLQAQLKTATMELRAYEIKCEALHCHQLMLVAQRAQLQKQLKDKETT